MITQDIKKALKGYFASMQKNITLVLQTGEHTKRDELKQFLSGVAEVREETKREEYKEERNLYS